MSAELASSRSTPPSPGEPQTAHSHAGMTANGIPRRLARKVALAVVMSPAAYGIEAIQEGQRSLPTGFSNLTAAIGRAGAGTLSTAKGKDSARAGDISPTKPAIYRRRERLLVAALAAPDGTPKRALLPPLREDDSSQQRSSKWSARASANGHLIREGQQAKRSAPTPRLRTHWVGRRNPTPVTCYAWTDGSLRESAGFGWLITTCGLGIGPALSHGSRSIGNRQASFDA